MPPSGLGVRSGLDPAGLQRSPKGLECVLGLANRDALSSGRDPEKRRGPEFPPALIAAELLREPKSGASLALVLCLERSADHIAE
jgi:hypothetical protein